METPIWSEGEKGNTIMVSASAKSIETSMMTTEGTTTKSRVVPQYQIFFDNEAQFSFAFLCLFGNPPSLFVNLFQDWTRQSKQTSKLFSGFLKQGIPPNHPF